MRLEIGGPPRPVPGYEQVDPNMMWGTDTLPDGPWDEVYAAHVIEHVPWWKVRFAISEAYRVLKTGGVFEVHTVDFNYLVKNYLEKTTGDDWTARGKNKEMHPLRWVASRIFSVGPDDNWHRAILDFPYLTELFEEAGFTNIERVKEPKGPQKHGIINVGIRGSK